MGTGCLFHLSAEEGRPTIEDDDEDEDDPIVGCQQLLVTPKIPLLPILKLLKQLIDCS